MKNSHTFILLLTALFWMPLNVLAQDKEDVIRLNKTVSETGPDQYEITLETFVTGMSVKSESTVMPPLNIVILADRTKAMWTNQQTQNLAIALRSFLHKIPSPTDPAQSHNFTIIPFDESVNENEVMSHLSSKDSTAVYDKVYGFSTSGSLYSKPEYAFARAITEIESFRNGPQANTNQTMVIFFTSTSRKNSGETAFDVNSGMAAVNLSYLIKQKGSLGGTKSVKLDNGNTVTRTDGLDCKVYSICNFKKTKTATTGEENNVKHFMNFVSSLYPDKWMTKTSDFVSTTEGTEMPNGDNTYHQFSFEPTEIGNMFEKIQEEIISPTISINETSVVTDIMSPDFKLPQGFNLNTDVKVYVQKCTYTNYPDYTFTETPVDVTDKVRIGLGDERTINVYGYNFAEHYCGYDDNKGKMTGHDGGQKLIIKFPIEPSPASKGGMALATNAATSGIIVDTQFDDEGNYIPETGGLQEAFTSPTLDLPNIIIRKTGLHKGESAVFEVKHDASGGNIFNVTATCFEEGQPAIVIIKLQKPGKWTVTERNSWSWAHDASAPVTKDVPTSEESVNGITGTVFSFDNPDKEATQPAHAEAMSNNIFNVNKPASKRVKTEY